MEGTVGLCVVPIPVFGKFHALFLGGVKVVEAMKLANELMGVLHKKTLRAHRGEEVEFVDHVGFLWCERSHYGCRGCAECVMVSRKTVGDNVGEGRRGCH